MIVLKFGGTSVQNAERMDEVLTITEYQIDRAPVLVSSAMSKITDSLLLLSQKAKSGEEKEALQLFEDIRNRHLSTAEAFLKGDNLSKAAEHLESYFTELHSLTRGLLLLKECTPRSLDAIASFGELMSTTLLYYRALTRGIQAEFADARDMVLTDDNFTSALPLVEETNKRIGEALRPEPGKIIITQGFIARTKAGATSTLGRGGSDYSATIFGAALNAEEVQIWTDVDGIMTTDPRIVPEAKTIAKISYEEAAELAYFGAKVVHPSTIQPAVEKNIPVLVKNTMNPQGKYTSIEVYSNKPGIRAIASKKDITLININSTRMLNAYGFLNRIFAIFDKYKTPVDLIATSEVSVSMTIDNLTYIEDIVKEAEKIGYVNVEQGKSIICLVGQNFWQDSAFVERVFKSLHGIKVRMISLGSSDINLSIVIPGASLQEAVQKLHREFFS
ncbi:MAG: lysine-sensitive aspartokinase 3 [Spirochaetales bacterium]|nr:MAG: lysine-sensitive aspartokinase 3 [Spirochaetales bacterium]